MNEFHSGSEATQLNCEKWTGVPLVNIEIGSPAFCAELSYDYLTERSMAGRPSSPDPHFRKDNHASEGDFSSLPVPP